MSIYNKILYYLTGFQNSIDKFIDLFVPDDCEVTSDEELEMLKKS